MRGVRRAGLIRRLHPSSFILHPYSARGFSLVEMLATVAALVIVLGLAVSLARSVRRQASDRLTKELLAQLDRLIDRYQERYDAVPAVPPFVPGGAGEAGGAGGGGAADATGAAGVAGVIATSLPASSLPLTRPAAAEDDLPPEAELQRNAIANNQAFVAAVRVEARRRPNEFAELPPSFHDEGALHDAWGTPIVFMPSMHPAVGMAMANRPFFLSAGPDRRFRTSEDNLYSYEEADADAGRSDGE
jgi:prepilin-type N-terminal cleavage/methylation domain-containing protein